MSTRRHPADGPLSPVERVVGAVAVAVAVALVVAPVVTPLWSSWRQSHATQQSEPAQDEWQDPDAYLYVNAAGNLPLTFRFAEAALAVPPRPTAAGDEDGDGAIRVCEPLVEVTTWGVFYGYGTATAFGKDVPFADLPSYQPGPGTWIEGYGPDGMNDPFSCEVEYDYAPEPEPTPTVTVTVTR